MWVFQIFGPPRHASIRIEILSDFDAQLLELKLKFAEQLKPRLAEIQAAWCEMTGAAPDAPTTAKARETLHHNVHYLAGAAVTFGFAALGANAAELDPRLERAVLSDGRSLREDWDRIAATIAKLNLN